HRRIIRDNEGSDDSADTHVWRRFALISLVLPRTRACASIVLAVMRSGVRTPSGPLIPQKLRPGVEPGLFCVTTFVHPATLIYCRLRILCLCLAFTSAILLSL